jgi:phytol kinase
MKHVKEYTRKSIHLIFGIFFLSLIYFLGTTISIQIIGACLVLGIIVSLIIKHKTKIPFLCSIVECVQRENERELPGKAAIMFFISAIILLFLFSDNKTIILASLSVQVFADAFAAIIGINFGKHKILGKKTLEGSTACFITALLCLNYFYPIQIALIAALIATIIELIPLDDNLWVPLFTASALKLLI